VTPLDWLIAAGVVGFATFFFCAGHYVGARRATARHLPALLLAAKKPPRADLRSTVARQPQQPGEANNA
jgi:hypothetical protein